MTPIIINTENQILEGVRRYMCYKDLKYKTVDVIVKDITKEEILFTIITSNFHRKNDCLQTLNIFDSLMEIYSHQGKKTSVLNETEVDKPKKKEDDTTRKKVCDMIGFSYSTIDKLKKIKNFNIELFTKIDEGKKTIHKVYKSIGKKVKDTINIKTDYSIQNVSDSKLFKVRKYDETSKMDGIVGKQIQCVVTSPPKFVGEETDKKRYIDDITNRLKECHKIMKDDGSLYLIMDDIRSESGVMTNIPYEVLFGLIGFGYNHIDTIIWEYPTPPMINGKNLIQSYKYIFHLTKSLTYYKNEVGRNFSRNVIPTNPNGKKEMYDKYRLYKGKDWNKVWLSDNIIKTNMFETIPIGLILDSTKEGDYVMNPFDTDESVGLVSLFYNRKFFGFTDDEEYVKIQSGILHSFLIENRKDG